jgi:hypothetical protein
MNIGLPSTSMVKSKNVILYCLLFIYARISIFKKDTKLLEAKLNQEQVSLSNSHPNMQLKNFIYVMNQLT